MRPRRSMLVWGSGIIPLVALGIVLGLTGGDANRCGTGHFDGVWDRARKHEIEEQFTSSGQGYAKRSFEIAAGRLDTWQGEWEGAHKQACEAFADDPVKLDRRVGCLQRKLSEFRALADVFATADVDVVVGATRATAHLPEIPRCMSPRAHTPEPTALQASVQKRIDEARALHYAGRYEDALLVASVALRDAEMDGSPALRARALYRVGAARFRRAHYEDALQALDGAVWLASEAGLDDLAAAAATLLVPIVGRRLGRPKQGEQWGRHASTFLARSGDEPLARARLANNLGQVDEAAGALEAARRRYEDAQAIKQTLLPNDHPERATTLLNLGAVAGKLGQMQAAREHLERSLEILERAHGPEHPALAGPLTNLGNVARATGDLEQAAARYLRAVEIREAAEGPTSPTLAAPLSNLGVVKSAMGQHAEAEDLHARAAALYEAAHGREHPRVASAFINRGDAAFRLGRLDAAAEDFVTAAEILAVAAPEHAMRLTALNNLGEVHLAAEHWEAARVAYDEAWAWAKARAAPKMAAARAAAGLGRGLVELDRGAEAVEPLSWALETLTKAGSPAGPLAKTEALLARAKG